MTAFFVCLIFLAALLFCCVGARWSFLSGRTGWCATFLVLSQAVAVGGGAAVTYYILQKP